MRTCMLTHFSHVQLFVTLWTVVCQAPLSMGFSRQEHRNWLPCPSPGKLPNPGIKLASFTSPTLAGRFFTTESSGSPVPYDLILTYLYLERLFPLRLQSQALSIHELGCMYWILFSQTCNKKLQKNSRSMVQIFYLGITVTEKNIWFGVFEDLILAIHILKTERVM